MGGGRSFAKDSADIVGSLIEMNAKHSIRQAPPAFIEVTTATRLNSRGGLRGAAVALPTQNSMS